MSTDRQPGTKPIGVLVMAHGTPSRPDDVEAFYTRIRRGSPPSPEQLAELTGRYEAIGGISPLAERTAGQVDGLAAALEAADPGRFIVRYGAKYTEPTIEQSAAALIADGVRTVVGVVLTPHRSTMGSGEYLRRATEALGDDVEFLPVEQWYDAPGFAALLAGRVHAALDRLPPSTEGARLVLFPAHSLPERVRTNGDPYPDQMVHSAELIAAEAGIDNWRVAWQSAGRTPEPWIGPDILEVIKALPDEGIGAVVVCPVGFVSDHLEVLFDVDIEAKAVADTAGVTLVRTPSLNADPEFLDILAKVVVATAGAGATS